MTDPRPVVPEVAEYWYSEIAVSQPGDDRRGWVLLKLLGALGVAFGRLHDVVRDRDAGPGWSVLLDPVRCFDWALPWLSQFTLRRKNTVGLTADQLRAKIISPPTFERGGRDAMREAVEGTLTGTRHVTIIERNGGDAYALLVVGRATETPDVAASTAAAKSQKPIGLLLTFSTSNGALIDEATAGKKIDAVTAGVKIDTVTSGDL